MSLLPSIRLRAGMLLAVCLAASLAHAAVKYRDPREVVYTGVPITVYVSRHHRTEVIFPEAIGGSLPPITSMPSPADGQPAAAVSGLDWAYGPAKDRVFLIPGVDKYSATWTLHGASGRSYILYLRDDREPDISLRMLEGKVTQEVAEAASAKTPRHKLIEYMMLNKTPPGYRRDVSMGKLNDRLVFRNGSVNLYLFVTYSSPRYTGLVLIVQNSGAAPVKFPINMIDFSDRRVRRALGDVKEISIASEFLGPHPDYVRDTAQPSHETLLFVTAAKDAPGSTRR